MCVCVRSDLVWSGEALTRPAGPAGLLRLWLLCWKPERRLGPSLQGWTADFPQSPPAGPADHKPTDTNDLHLSTPPSPQVWSNTNPSLYLVSRRLGRQALCQHDLDRLVVLDRFPRRHAVALSRGLFDHRHPLQDCRPAP